MVGLLQTQVTHRAEVMKKHTEQESMRSQTSSFGAECRQEHFREHIELVELDEPPWILLNTLYAYSQ